MTRSVRAKALHPDATLGKLILLCARGFDGPAFERAAERLLSWGLLDREAECARIAWGDVADPDAAHSLCLPQPGSLLQMARKELAHHSEQRSVLHVSQQLQHLGWADNEEALRQAQIAVMVAAKLSEAHDEVQALWNAAHRKLCAMRHADAQQLVRLSAEVMGQGLLPEPDTMTAATIPILQAALRVAFFEGAAITPPHVTLQNALSRLTLDDVQAEAWHYRKGWLYLPCVADFRLTPQGRMQWLSAQVICQEPAQVRDFLGQANKDFLMLLLSEVQKAAYGDKPLGPKAQEHLLLSVMAQAHSEFPLLSGVIKALDASPSEIASSCQQRLHRLAVHHIRPAADIPPYSISA